MLQSRFSQEVPTALIRAVGHWDALHQRSKERDEDAEHGVAIAVSREAGTSGSEIARLVGERLNWPVFDHELLERIADEMHVRVDVVESVDERHQSWLLESIEALAPRATVSENSYLRRLVETVCSLAANGNCIIVGRGAAQFLPAASTVRVRVIAPLADRIARTQQQEQMSPREAERCVTTRERQRRAFVKEHFQKDPQDPRHYDLLVNTHNLSNDDCAELIVVAAKLRVPTVTGAGPAGSVAR